ncbi:hypothetical protein ACH46_11480 [Gordonia phthalatica]|uniref:Uncharacterized protein n=1 Tax=Gordonia phthalatica TaxID=1136941 RepID=A0A0N9MQ87_9ACTN|nr:hypothetical protein ACH46_11480 [Gordonia phthalatica]
MTLSAVQLVAAASRLFLAVECYLIAVAWPAFLIPASIGYLRRGGRSDLSLGRRRNLGEPAESAVG